MRFQNLLFILIISIVFTGCGSCEEQSNVSTNSNTPYNDTSATINNSETTNENLNTNIDQNQPTPIPAGETLEKPKEKIAAVTLKPVVEAYCGAMRNKDNAALRNVYSKSALQAMEAEMRKDGVKSLYEYLQSEDVGNKCEVVNEQIQGNAAKAYVITETYPTGTSFNFVKENNEWKMTNESDEFDSVDKN